VKLSSTLTIEAICHGKAVFTQEIRSLCLRERFNAIAVDIPEVFEQDLRISIEKLPLISVTIARGSSGPVYYVPSDPCDATIEGIRQSFQNHIPFYCIGHPILGKPEPLPPLPDEYAATKIGFDRYNALCIHAVGNPEEDSADDIAAQFIAFRIRMLEAKHGKILAIVHLRHFVRVLYHLQQEKTYNLSFNHNETYEIENRLINTDHLYFALGELPFVTGKFEKERHDLFAEQFDIVNTIKDLFRETRDNYFDEQDRIAELSPVRIQAALTFLRNLTVMSDRFIPSLFDIIESAKGVGGNSYAVRILKSAKYYPYIPIDTLEQQVSVGIDKINVPEWGGALETVNLFRDVALEWKTVSIKPDPSELRKKQYRYTWNPLGMCSHVPEDLQIESFNAHVRQKTLKVLVEDYVKAEKFRTSVKDGIDIRETLRNWHTGEIFVKEIPPSRGKVDTVIIIFDENHDEKYPNQTAWYAEHDEESTLTFYASDPFENMIGPGIARCYYGGLSLLYPPRQVPNIFEITNDSDFPDLASRLTYGALQFSSEKVVAYVAQKKPGTVIRKMAAHLKKHIVWIPIASFSNETIRRLRRFHILNGKIVRSWAGRFIGD
jgi:hypothetical protein